MAKLINAYKFSKKIDKYISSTPELQEDSEYYRGKLDGLRLAYYMVDAQPAVTTESEERVVAALNAYQNHLEGDHAGELYIKFSDGTDLTFTGEFSLLDNMIMLGRPEEKTTDIYPIHAIDMIKITDIEQVNYR